MRYIWETGKKRRKMHVAKHTITGEMLFESLCDIGHNFNRSINAPFSLGRGVCKNCGKNCKRSPRR